MGIYDGYYPQTPGSLEREAARQRDLIGAHIGLAGDGSYLRAAGLPVVKVRDPDAPIQPSTNPKVVLLCSKSNP